MVDVLMNWQDGVDWQCEAVRWCFCLQQHQQQQSLLLLNESTRAMCVNVSGRTVVARSKCDHYYYRFKLIILFIHWIDCGWLSWLHHTTIYKCGLSMKEHKSKEHLWMEGILKRNECIIGIIVFFLFYQADFMNLFGYFHVFVFPLYMCLARK